MCECFGCPDNAKQSIHLTSESTRPCSFQLRNYGTSPDHTHVVVHASAVLTHAPVSAVAAIRRPNKQRTCTRAHPVQISSLTFAHPAESQPTQQNTQALWSGISWAAAPCRRSITRKTLAARTPSQPPHSRNCTAQIHPRLLLPPSLAVTSFPQCCPSAEATATAASAALTPHSPIGRTCTHTSFTPIGPTATCTSLLTLSDPLFVIRRSSRLCYTPKLPVLALHKLSPPQPPS